MRITFLLPYAGLQGGVRVPVTYASRLSERGHKVVLVSTPRRVSFLRKLKQAVLRRHRRDAGEMSHITQNGIEHRILERYRPMLDSDVPDADVVVATWWETAHWAHALAPRKGARAILIQGYEVERGDTNPGLDAAWRLPMHKIVISKWLAKLAEEKFGDGGFSLVPNSVDLGLFSAPERGKAKIPTVGFLFSRSRLKACHVGLEVLQRLAVRFPDLRVLSFGMDEPGIVSLRLPRGAEFHLRPPQHQIKAIYQQCDVWLSTSVREGFGLTILEAMACRCPVVSTRAGGPEDIVSEGVNGHLADVGDTERLADRVARVLNLPESEWAAMSAAAYRRAASYSWDDATDLLEQALQLALERSRQQRPFEHARCA